MEKHLTIIRTENLPGIKIIGALIIQMELEIITMTVSKKKIATEIQLEFIMRMMIILETLRNEAQAQLSKVS